MTMRSTLRGALAAALVIGCLWGGGPARASVPPAPATATAGVPSSSRNAGPAGLASRGDDGQDIRDIHGPVPPPRRLSVAWLAAAAVSAAALGAALIYRSRRRPPLMPHQRALRALEEVGPLLGGGDPRAFSFAVSEIVRSYVETSFSLPAAHRTTEELLEDLMRDQSPVAAHRDTLGNFLVHCDLAKFAGWSLTVPDMAALLDSAVAFVRATSPDGVPSPCAVAAPPSTRTRKGAVLA